MAKSAIRVQALKITGGSVGTLAGAELHGKRQDASSQSRIVQDLPPLIHGGLDLRDLFQTHVKGYKRHNKLNKPVLHVLLQFPKVIRITEQNLRRMLEDAIRFVNDTLGGAAVFAARIDRDEKGQHAVDVFATPRYEKNTQQHGKELWISNSHHLKILCEKRREDIVQRFGRFGNNSREIGFCWQIEWRDFLMQNWGLDIDAPTPKANSEPDWLPPEIIALKLKLQRAIRIYTTRLNELDSDRAEFEVYRAAEFDELLQANEELNLKKSIKKILYRLDGNPLAWISCHAFIPNEEYRPESVLELAEHFRAKIDEFTNQADRRHLTAALFACCWAAENGIPELHIKEFSSFEAIATSLITEVHQLAPLTEDTDIAEFVDAALVDPSRDALAQRP